MPFNAKLQPRGRLSRRALRYGLLPVLAVEPSDLERTDIDAFEAAHVHVDLIGVGARHVVAVNTAMAAEVMLRDPRIESIGRQIGASGEKLERLFGHDEVQEALLRADRAVALARARQIRADSVAH